MKLTTPLKAFLLLTLLSGAANAANLALGGGGLGQNHTTGPGSPGTLVYTDPASGIKISYTGQPHGQYTDGASSRGWNNDPNPFVTGSTGIGTDHLSIAHFGGAADSITVDFSTATGVNTSLPISILVYDLDTPGGQETLDVTDDGGTTTLSGVAGNVLGDLTHTHIVASGSSSATIVPNLAGGNQFSGFDISYTAIPEPTSGLLALIGGSFLFLRRRR